ncbi:MAG: L-threonylcarbamoyladenylate synthase [Treponemataceae bacterium]|nr:L-threonylcarbamoyladenylate synthase [Treponemataceae bacterium]
MQILSGSPGDIEKAAGALREGLLVAFPTETVYGLGADARNPHALARVFEAKRRPAFDPLIIHLARREELEQVANVGALPESRRALVAVLAENLWPGPLTLVLPKQDWVPDLATSGLPTVAVRVPSHPVAQALLQVAGIPVAAPSANPFGYLSPTCAAHVASQLGERVDYIIDGGPCTVGVESTVLDMTGDVPRILRPGGTPQEKIEALIGPVAVVDRTNARPTAPGQLPSHYAPRAELILYDPGQIPPLAELVGAYLGTTGQPDAAAGTHRQEDAQVSSEELAFLAAHATETAAAIETKPANVSAPFGGSLLQRPIRWGFLFFDTPSRDAWYDRSGLRPGRAQGESEWLTAGQELSCVIQVLSPHSDVVEGAANLFMMLHHFDEWGVSCIFAERVPNRGVGVAVNDRLFKARGAAKSGRRE